MSRKKLFKLLWGISLTSVVPLLIGCTTNEKKDTKEKEKIDHKKNLNDAKVKLNELQNHRYSDDFEDIIESWLSKKDHQKK